MVLYAGDFDPREFHELLGGRLFPGAGGDGVLPAVVCRASLEARAVLVFLVCRPTFCGMWRGRLYSAGRADWEKV